jgi:hypothetical protein
MQLRVVLLNCYGDVAVFLVDLHALCIICLTPSCRYPSGCSSVALVYVLEKYCTVYISAMLCMQRAGWNGWMD